MHTHKRVKSMKTEAITNKVLYKTHTSAHHSKHAHTSICMYRQYKYENTLLIFKAPLLVIKFNTQNKTTNYQQNRKNNTKIQLQIKINNRKKVVLFFCFHYFVLLQRAEPANFYIHMYTH